MARGQRLPVDAEQQRENAVQENATAFCIREQPDHDDLEHVCRLQWHGTAHGRWPGAGSAWATCM